MPRLLAPEHTALRSQRLEHVPVADVGRERRGRRSAIRPVEAEVRHLRHRNEVDAEMESERRR